MAAGQCNYYLDLGRSDYYLEGGEPPGQWLGQAARELGLEGQVSPEALRNLFEGYAPDGGRELVQLGRGHQPGWDLCFSAPKSVSVVWAVGEREAREAIQEAHDRAVEAAVGYLEDAASFTRRGRGGAELERAGLCVATFQHGTSRAQDPQLHTHALVLNVALREDGRFGTLRSRDLYQHKMAAGALYRSELAARLRELGFELERDRSAFRIQDVPKALEELFSKRRAAIEAELKARGKSGDAVAAERAALTTREVKGHVARDELFSTWREEAGRTFEAPVKQGKGRGGGGGLEAVAATALATLEKKQSFFLERDVVREMALELQDRGAPVDRIHEAAQKALEGRGVAHLGREHGYQYFATHATLEREASVLGHAAELAETVGHKVKDRHLEAVIADRPTLKDEQRDALESLARGGDLVLVEGLAGTGKTYLLEAAREVWEREGYTVRGAAVAGKAALELQGGAGIESKTLARTLLELERKPLTRNDVLVVDEAGMVGMNELERVLDHARQAGAKVCLAGDYRQLPAIEDAAPFRRLCTEHGAAELREVSRQHELWEREALTQLAEGDVRGALSQYALAGRLHQAQGNEQAREELLEAWRWSRTTSLERTLVLTATNEDRHELNKRMQEERLRQGELDRDQCAYRGNERFFVGDRVLFTVNDRSAGYANGDLGVIERVSGRDELTVRLDRYQDGRPVRVTAEVNDSIDLGYALTTHKAQGQTVDRAFVLGSATLQSRELAYVQLSRARERTDLFFSETDAGEDLAELKRAMERSTVRALALEEQERLRELELGREM